MSRFSGKDFPFGKLPCQQAPQEFIRRLIIGVWGVKITICPLQRAWSVSYPNLGFSKGKGKHQSQANHNSHICNVENPGTQGANT